MESIHAINAALRRTPEIVNIKSAQLTTKGSENNKSYICGKYVIQSDDSKIQLFLSKTGLCLRTITLPGRITVVQPWEKELLLFVSFECRKSDHCAEVHIFSIAQSLTPVRRIKITSDNVCHISPVFIKPSLSHRVALSPHLLDFNGLAVFSTSTNIYLVDLNLDESPSFTSTLTDLEILDPNIIPEVREELYNDNTTVAIELNHCRHKRDIISALTVSIRTSMLFIGFDNGNLIYYSLKLLRLIHHAPNEDETYGTIRHLIIQEPDNDPRKVCYLWQCSQYDTQIQLELFQLEFRKREVTKTGESQRRMFYDDLMGVTHRFSTWRQGDILNAFALELYDSYTPETWDDWMGATPTKSLLVFGLQEDKYRLYMFDINGYYNARCPASLGHRSQWDRRYFTIMNIADYGPDALRIQTKSIKHFEFSDRGGPLLMTESDITTPTEPESLTFTIDIVMDNIYEESMVHSRQTTALRSLNKADNLIKHPEAVHKELEFARLTMNQIKKSGGDKESYSIKDALVGLSKDEKVECILTSALFFGHLSDLHKFFKLSAGEEDTTKLYEWGKGRALRLKKRLNRLQAKLFISHGADFFRSHTWKRLNAIQQLYFDLHSMYQAISNEDDYLTKACLLNQRYAYVLCWFVKRSILPEVGSDLSWNYQLLADSYRMNRLRLRGKSLMVDLVVDMVVPVAGAFLDSWNDKKEYPPPSLKCILDMILSLDVRTVITGSILCYAVSDILRTNKLSEDMAPIEDEIMTLFGMLGMEPKFVKYIHACWYLDNGYFGKAIKTFNGGACDPIVVPSHWQRILSILMDNDRPKDALQILSMHPPPTSTDEDFYTFTTMKIDIYLANKLVFEAVKSLQQARQESESFNWRDAFKYFASEAFSKNLKNELLRCQLSVEEKKLVLDVSPSGNHFNCLEKYYGQLKSSLSRPRSSYRSTPHPKTRKSLLTPTKEYFSPLQKDRRMSSIFDEEKELAHVLFSSPSISTMRSLVDEPTSTESLVPSQSLFSTQHDDGKSPVKRSIRFKSESSHDVSEDVTMSSQNSSTPEEKILILDDDDEEDDDLEEEVTLADEIALNNASVYDTPDVSITRPKSTDVQVDNITVAIDSTISSNDDSFVVVPEEEEGDQKSIPESINSAPDKEDQEELHESSDVEVDDNPSIIVIPEEAVKVITDETVTGSALRKDTSMDGDRMTVSDSESMVQEEHFLLRRHTIQCSSVEKVPRVEEAILSDEGATSVNDTEPETLPMIVATNHAGATIEEVQNESVTVELEVTAGDKADKPEIDSTLPVLVELDQKEETLFEYELVAQISQVQEEAELDPKDEEASFEDEHVAQDQEEVENIAVLPIEDSVVDDVVIEEAKEVDAEEVKVVEAEEVKVVEAEDVTNDVHGAQDEVSLEDEPSQFSNQSEETPIPSQAIEAVDETTGMNQSDLLKALETVGESDARDLRELHRKIFGKSTVVTRTTQATIKRKLKKALKSKLDDLAVVETVTKTIGEPVVEPVTEPAGESAVEPVAEPVGVPAVEPVAEQTDDSPEPSLPKKIPSTPRRRKSSETRPSTPVRRSSRIRNQSGASDVSESGNESDVSLASTTSTQSTKSTKSTKSRKPPAARKLKPVPENEEPLFSPPRALRKSESSTHTDPIPFTFTTPKRNRKRSVDELDVDPAVDSPAKKTKSQQDPKIETDNSTPLRRITRSRKAHIT